MLANMTHRISDSKLREDFSLMKDLNQNSNKKIDHAHLEKLMSCYHNTYAKEMRLGLNKIHSTAKNNKYCKSTGIQTIVGITANIQKQNYLYALFKIMRNAVEYSTSK